MIPRFGDAVRKDIKYRKRPGVYAIITNGSDVLLTHQSEPVPEVQLPGGGIDPGESPLRALYREVIEETGWTIAAPRRLGAFREFTYMPEYDLWAEKICHIYLARAALRLSGPQEDDHFAFWVSPRAAAGLVDVDGARWFLSRLFGE